MRFVSLLIVLTLMGVTRFFIPLKNASSEAILHRYAQIILFVIGVELVIRFVTQEQFRNIVFVLYVVMPKGI